MKKIIIFSLILLLIFAMLCNGYLYFNDEDIEYAGQIISVGDNKINITISDNHYIECDLHSDGKLSLTCFSDLTNCLKEY